jgi:hypothetical protein
MFVVFVRPCNVLARYCGTGQPHLSSWYAVIFSRLLRHAFAQSSVHASWHGLPPGSSSRVIRP